MLRLSHDGTPIRARQEAFVRSLGGRYRGVLGGKRAAIIDQQAWRDFWEAWVDEVRPIGLRRMLLIGERELSEWRRGLRIVVSIETLARLSYHLPETAAALDVAHPGRGLQWLRCQQQRLSEATDRQVIEQLREWCRARRSKLPPSQVTTGQLEELICWDPPARALAAGALAAWRRVTARELARLKARPDPGRLLVLELLGEQETPEAWVVDRPLPARLAHLMPSIFSAQQSRNEDSSWRRRIRIVLSRALVPWHDGLLRAVAEARDLGVWPGGGRGSLTQRHNQLLEEQGAVLEATRRVLVESRAQLRDP